MSLPLIHRPHPGDVLICDFDTGFMPPEMVKKRPVVVVSVHRSHGRGLCTVVPLSTTAPDPVLAWHHPLPHVKIKGWPEQPCSWAKIDMLATVGYGRLNKPYHKTRHGRVFLDLKLDDPDLTAIQVGMRTYLGL